MSSRMLFALATVSVQDRSRLQVERAGGCGSCSVKSSCGTGLFARTDPHCFDVPDGANLRGRGDESVAVSISAAALPAHCAAVFLGLAGLMLAGSVLATLLPFMDGDFGATVGAFSGLVVGAILLRLYDSHSGGLHLLRRLVVKPSESV